MNWRFHILDRNNVLTEVEEPVGFDALTCEISRDPDWHGVFFTNSGDSFEFYGTAYRLLKAEYEQYGAQGDMTFIIEEECDGTWTEFDRGKFVFSKYDPFPDDCYVKCPLEGVGDVMDLVNQRGQKVNLDSLKAFDETTDLVPYDKLSFDLPLPSKGIYMQDKAELQFPVVSDIDLPTEIQFNSDGLENYNYGWFQIVPQMDKQDLSEFGTFLSANSPEHEFVKSGFYDQRLDNNLTPVVQQSFPNQRWLYFDWSQASALLINDNFMNNFDAIDSFSADISYSFDLTLANANIISLYTVLVIRRSDGTYEYLDKNQIVNGIPGGGYAGFNSGSIWLAGSTNTIEFSASHPTISLGNGDYLFMVVCGLCAYSNFDARDALKAYTITPKTGSVSLQTLTHFKTTISKVYAINEVISRVAESLTNDKLRAYSEYFGRTDSQPYAVTEDGCGALEAITNGIRIRGQENKTPGQVDVFSQSMDDIFKGICPIHNIGMGIEPDTNRAGYNRLRVEPWTFFYNDTLVMSCVGIDNINRPANDKEIYSTFEFGYNTWEAEEYNGLDELLTKRAYRTAINQVKNDFQQISTFISSGYALEVTRRKGNADTKDWRYDNNTFIICLKRGASASFLIAFEAGNTMKVAVFGDDYTLAEQFFVAGKTVDINGNLNTGTFHITAVSRITGNLSVTVSETLVDELKTVTITNADTLGVELGNVTNPVNIVDPDTLYNYRISPIRNAMRWMNKVLASYRQFNADSKIIFTAGDGNYFAEGEMTDANCRLETAALAENQTIDLNVFADSADAKPISFPERVKYTFPFRAKDYVAIKANPGGKIYFESTGDSGYGWIDSIQWTPKEGTATFSIIPKFTN